jgi:hypothetical protein
MRERERVDNGFRKVATVKNVKVEGIHERVDLYANSSGISPLKPKFPIMTENESIRGIWSPFKDPKIRVTHKPQAPKHLYANN